MSDFVDNFYVRLGIPKNATREEIREAYHQAARRLHPDANAAPEAHEQFLSIQEAYDTLFDAKRRDMYDSRLPPLDTSPGVIISKLYSRDVVTPSTFPQLLYVLLDIIPAAQKIEKTRPPLNLCLVIDSSTSMRGARMDVVKVTAQELIRDLRPDDVLSLVTFNDRAEVIFPAARVADPHRILARISLIQPGGGTEIFHGLQMGMAQIARNFRPSHLNHLILITDGHTYGDEPACLELAEEARSMGLPISGLGIGSEWNDVFLDQVTSKTGGNSRFVQRPSDIRQFLAEKFHQMNQVYAENLVLKFQLQPGIVLRELFRLTPEPTPLSVTSPVSMGNLLHGQEFFEGFAFVVYTRIGKRFIFVCNQDVDVLRYNFV